MGRKQTGAGQFIYFSITVLIFSWLSGCVTLEKVTAPETPGDTQKIGKPEEFSKSMAAILERAAQLCSQRDYDGAFRENERVLSLSGKNPPGDRALFNMGLIYAHSENPKKDYEKASRFLQRIVKDYPQSSLVEEAKTWAKVLQENERSRQESERFRRESERLKRVMDQSKEVDLLVDKKKRDKER
jgi:tetratricopeptide (TPR) repeat protein